MQALSPLDEPTLPEALLSRAKASPDACALIVFESLDRQRSYTIGELFARASVYREELEERAPRRGSLVWLCLPPDVELHASFLGTLLAGHLPAIVAPPSPRMEIDKYARSFAAMLRHLDPELVVSEDRVTGALEELDLPAFSRERLIEPPAFAKAAGPAFALGDIRLDPPDPDSLALLQHSSGTTGIQKGVALSHRAVLAQVRSYARAIRLDKDDVIASWLPLYHDMGFIACLVMPLLTGVPVVQLSPFDWVSRPMLLAEAVRAHRATLCWLPNFAYAFMSTAIRPSSAAQADLSTIRCFINCSEPVLAASERRFVRAFAARGVSETKLAACYAMAENVFAVTQTPPGRAPRIDRIDRESFTRHRAEPSQSDEAVELVSNGPPIEGVEVRIRDADGLPAGERRIGEIEIRGESVFDGYFRRDDGPPLFEDGWFATGDLGYLADGELFVTGRKKELIIIQGRNFYPHDIETAVGELDGIVPGRVVAFGEKDRELGTEKLIVIAESDWSGDEALRELTLSVRGLVAQSFDCTASEVHLVARKWVVKSTSGKLARPDNRAKYESLLKS